MAIKGGDAAPVLPAGMRQCLEVSDRPPEALDPGEIIPGNSSGHHLG